MSEVDISGLVSSTVLDPVEAANGIQGAKIFDTDVDTYIRNKSEYQKQFQDSLVPTTAPKVVADYMNRGPAYTAAVKDDIDKLSMFDKFTTRLKRRDEQSDISREMTPLILKKSLQNGALSQSDELNLERLRILQDEAQQDKNYDPITNFPVEMYGVAKDMVMGLVENRNLIYGGAAAGGLTGAVLGAPGGIAGAGTVGAIGAIKGASVGAFAASTFDTFKQTKAQIYDTLDTMEDPKTGQPLSIPEADKSALSNGAAALVAGIDYFGDKAIAKFLPGVGGIVDPKAIAKRAMLDAGSTEFKNVLLKIGRSEIFHSALTEGGTEALQEAIQLIAEETGRSWDGTNPTSVWSGVKNAADKWDTSLSRIGTAGTLGAIAGGGMATIGKATQAPFNKKNKTEINIKPETPTINPELPPVITPEEQLQADHAQALDNQLHLVQASAVTKNTTLYQNAPNEAASLRNKMLDQNGGMRVQYVDIDEINAYIAKSPENAALVKTTLGDESFAQSDIGAPLQIPIDKVMALVDADPKAAALFSKAPELPSVTGVEAKKQAIAKGPDYKENIQTANQHLEQEVFTKTLKEKLPEKFVLKQEAAQMTAKVDTVEAITQAAEKEMNKVIDTNMDIAMAVEREQLEMEIKNNPEVTIVDQQSKFKITINPNSLPQDLRIAETNQNLNKRKVFSPNGMNIKDAVRMFGVDNEYVLLDILANTPDSKEAVQRILDSRESDIKAKVEDSVDLHQEAIVKAYENRSQLHRRELKYMLQNSWSDLKGGIKRIALPLKTIPEIRVASEKMISDTKLKDLNVNRFKVGERKSLTKAVDAILKNEVEHAYTMKENALKNTELVRATYIAIGESNRNIRYLKRTIKSDNIKASLKKAGPKFYGAFVELVDTFNLDKNLKGRSVPGAFAKFVKTMQEEGRGNYSIDPSIFVGVPTDAKLEDLTVKQVDAITQTIKGIVHQAKDTEQFTQIKNEIAAQVKEKVTTHPERDLNKLSNKLREVGLSENISAFLAKGIATLTPPSFITQRLDEGKVGGYFSKTFYLKLKEGEARAKTRGLELQKKYLEAVKIYGEKDFAKLANTVLPDIPEFASINSLNNGKNLTKADLFMMMTHWGEIDGRERLENFGVDQDTLFNVMQQHLTTKDVDFIQNAIWGQYANLKNEVKELEIKTKGVIPQFIEPASFTFNGKEYAGGHMPAYYSDQFDINGLKAKAVNFTNSMLGTEKTDYRPGFTASGMTKANYLRERIGSNKFLNLDVSTITVGFDEVIWDLNMREPVKETMALLTDKEIASDIISVVGKEQYNVLFNSTLEATHSALADQMQLYADQKSFIKKILNSFDHSFAITHLAANMGSLMIQPLSLFNAIERMGVGSGTKHLSYVMAKMGSPTSWHKFGDMYKLVIDINPDIGSYLEETNDASVTGLRKFQPIDRKFKNKTYVAIKNVQEGLNERLMNKLLGAPDFIQKFVVTLAAYNQHLAGEAPGHSLESMAHLSEAERLQAAKDYARHLSATTMTTTSKLDKAGLQKTPGFEHFIRFWNDARNQLNNAFQVNRNIKYDIRKVKEAVAEGEYTKAVGHFDDAGTKLLTMFWISSTMALYQNMLNANGEEIADDDVGKTVGNIAAFYGKFALSPMKNLEYRYGTSMPIIRDMFRSLRSKEEGFRKLSQISIPILKIPMDVVTAYSGLQDVQNFTRLKPNEQKAVLSSVSYFTGGLPVNGAMWVYENLDTFGLLGLAGIGLSYNAITKTKNLLTSSAKDNSEPLPKEEQKNQFFANQEEVNREFALLQQEKFPEELQGELKNYYRKLIKAESGGDPSIVNTASGALGIYQITADTWAGLRKNHPEANLSEYKPKKDKNGDYVKPDQVPSIEEQNRAIKFLVGEHLAALSKNGLLASEDNLYALHFMGQYAGIKLLKEDYQAKRMSALLPGADRSSWKAIREDNPDMRFEGAPRDLKEWRVHHMKKWINATINKLP